LHLLVAQIDENLIENGIYRVSGLEADIKDLRSQLDRVKPPVSITEFSSHVVADVLKLYFRELPEPLLTYGFYDLAIDDLYKKKESDNDLYIQTLGEMLRSLPIANYCIIKFLARHLFRVERYSAYNLMGSTNLAIVFGPTLLSPKIESIEHTLKMPRIYSVVQCLIEKYDILFKENLPSLPVFKDHPPLPVTLEPAISLSKNDMPSIKDEKISNGVPPTPLSNSNFENTTPLSTFLDHNQKKLRPAKSVGRFPSNQSSDSMSNLTSSNDRSILQVSNTPLEDNTDEILKNRNLLSSNKITNVDKNNDPERKLARERPVRTMRSKLSLKKSVSMRDSLSLAGSFSSRELSEESLRDSR